MTWSAASGSGGTTPGIGPLAGPSTFTLTPVAVGDLILLEVINTTGSGGGTASALSSSNVTWSAFGSSFTGTTNNGWTAQVFGGKVTSTSSATVTITWSGTTPSGHVTIDGDEFSSTAGSWAFDTSGHIDSAGTNTWPSLTPAGSGELYFGYALNAGSASAGATSGFTYQVDSNFNGVAYDLNVSAASAPGWGDSGQAFGIMVLVKETPAASTSPLLLGRTVTGKRGRKGTSQGSGRPLLHIEEVAQPLGTLVRGRPGKRGRAQGSPAPLLHIEEVIPPTGATVRGKPGRKGRSQGSPPPLVPPPVPSVQPPAATGKSVTGRKGRKGSSSGSPLPEVRPEILPAVTGMSVRGRPGKRGSSAGSKPIPVAIREPLAVLGALVRGRPGRKGSSKGSTRIPVNISAVVTPQQGTVAVTTALAGAVAISNTAAGSVAITDTAAGSVTISSTAAGTVSISNQQAGTVTIVNEL